MHSTGRRCKPEASVFVRLVPPSLADAHHVQMAERAFPGGGGRFKGDDDALIVETKVATERSHISVSNRCVRFENARAALQSGSGLQRETNDFARPD